jgi:hypothetical protein
MPRRPAPVCDLSKAEIELWIDDPVSKVTTPAYFDLLDAHGVDGIAVMVDDSPRPWDPKYSLKRIEKLGKLCGTRERKKNLALTDWPYPDKTVINAMCKGMERLIIATGLEEVEWEDDTEHNWTGRMVRGFRPMVIKGRRRSALDLAGDYWLLKKIETIARLKAKHGIVVRSSQTTFTSHTENGRAADLAPEMDMLINQAYAVRHRNKRNPRTGKYDVRWVVPETHVYGPGNMVKYTLDRTLLVPGIDDGHPELACGLAIYDQGRWPMGPDAAVILCVDVAVGAFDVRIIRFWSSKWAVGIKSSKSPYGKRILKTLAKARGRI